MPLWVSTLLPLLASQLVATVVLSPRMREDSIRALGAVFGSMFLAVALSQAVWNENFDCDVFTCVPAPVRSLLAGPPFTASLAFVALVANACFLGDMERLVDVSLSSAAWQRATGQESATGTVAFDSPVSLSITTAVCVIVPALVLVTMVSQWVEGWRAVSHARQAKVVPIVTPGERSGNREAPELVAE